MAANKRSVHSVVRPVLHWFVHSVFRSLLRVSAPTVDRLIVNSFIRLSICSSDCSFAHSSVGEFICVCGLFSCFSVCRVLLATHDHNHYSCFNQSIIIHALILNGSNDIEEAFFIPSHKKKNIKIFQLKLFPSISVL